MYDIFYQLNDKNAEQYETLKSKFPTVKKCDGFKQAQKRAFTKFFWYIPSDVLVLDDFDFDYVPDAWSNEYVHLFKNGEHYDGINLFPKRLEIREKELQHRFFVNKKEVDIQVSVPKQYDFFYVDTFEEYERAFEQTTTELFWVVSRNLTIDPNFDLGFYFSHHNSYDRRENHAFVHSVEGKELYNGVFLCSIHKQLNKKQVDYKFIVNRKEWEITASGPCEYEQFEVVTYVDYLKALKMSKTEMFWMVPERVQVEKAFKFDMYFSHDNEYDRTINHVFLNGDHFDGIVLCSKHNPITQKEFDYRFVSQRKEHATVASQPKVKDYDIVFISYNEPNADENWEDLKERFPRAQRIHGVKGIHQAHIEAAKLCTTDLFFVVDGDATIVDSFDFRYKGQEGFVHVWRSINPINDLVYGYGGVKLLPRDLTLNMDTSKPDMTTSISEKFKAMPDISCITNFNTDPFSTWKGAFRECCKLSSKVIDRQKNEETDDRLRTWTTVGKDRPYGEWAIKGAKQGSAYGTASQGNSEALKKINDFDWLQEKFNENT